MNIRQHIYNTALFLVFVLALGTHGLLAQGNESPTLVGSWTFDHGLSMSKMTPEMQQHLDSLPQLRQQVLTAYEGRKVVFGPNGEYVQSLADGRSMTATWSLAGNVITITAPSGASTQEQLTFLDGNRLTLVPMVSGDTKAIIPEWHFIKDQN